MTQESTALRRPAALYVRGVIAVGAAVLAQSAWQLATSPVDPRWILLVLLTMATGWVMLRIPSGEISFSISDTFNIAAAVLFGPAAGAITAALDGLVLSAHFARHRRTLDRVLFNAAAPATAIWIAAQLCFALAGDAPFLEGPWAVLRLTLLLAAFAAVNYLLGTGLVAAAVSLQSRLPLLAVWRRDFVGLWVTHFGGVLAVIPLLLFQRIQGPMSLLEMLVLVTPLPIILYTTFRHAVGRAQDQVAHLGQVNRVYVAVIEALAHAIDAKDQVTHDHIRRVQYESVRLARTLGVAGDDQLQALMAAALLHDVGKLAVPEHILNKPGRLTPSEFEVMKRHAPAGAEILSVVGFPYPVVPIVRHHHENWDGSGYPDGISGEAIPIGARILAVVDCFDALTSHRPYRPRMSDQEALRIVVSRRGTMYDPRVVDAFVELRCAEAITAAPAGETAVAAPAGDAAGASAFPEDGHLADLRAVADLAASLATALSIADVAGAIRTHLLACLPASTVVLYAHAEDRGALLTAWAEGEDARQFLGSEVPLGERLSGWVAAARQAVVNSDARLDVAEMDRDASPLRSALAVPVESRGALVAVLTFYARTDGAYAESHQRVAQAAAHAIGRSVPGGVFALARGVPVQERHTGVRS